MPGLVLRPSFVLRCAFAWCLTVGLSMRALAQIPHVINQLAEVDGSDLAATTAPVWSQLDPYNAVSSPSGAVFSSEGLVVRMMLNTGEDHDLGTAEFQVDLRVRLQALDADDNVLYEELVELGIRGLPGEDVHIPEAVLERDLSTFASTVSRLRLERWDQPTPGYTRTGNINDEQVHFMVTTERRRRVHPTINDPLLSLKLDPPSSLVNSNQIRFAWRHGLSPHPVLAYPAYQFQLLRLYNMADGANLVETTIQTQVDWSQAITIDTYSQDLSLNLSLTQGTGFYTWRVRPIANWHPGGRADSRNFGAWSTALQGSPQLVRGSLNGAGPAMAFYATTTGDAHTFYYEQFDDDRNWTYERSFSEGDAQQRIPVRAAEGITYSDQLLRPEQTQAHSTVGNIVTTATTVNDFSGRPALQSLAVPLPQQKSLGYVQGLLSTENGTPYSAWHFDVTRETATADPNGAFKYFSSANPDTEIPDAQGYPFARTLFLSDGTGAAEQTSAPGLSYALTSPTAEPHTPKSFSSAVQQTELTRLFGEQAYDVGSVQKTLTIDGNGQASTAYYDKSGKVLATALKENNNTDLDDLESEQYAAYDAGGTVTQVQPDGDHANVKSTTVAVVRPTMVTMSYTLTPAEIRDECLPDLCAQCDYHIEFFAFDENCPGTNLLDGQTVYTVAGESVVGALQASALTCTSSTPLFQRDYSVQLPASGSYTMGRRITVNNPVMNDLAPVPEGPMEAETYHDDQANEAYDAMVGAVLDPLIAEVQNMDNPLEDMPAFYAAHGVQQDQTSFTVSVPGGSNDPPCFTATLPVLTCGTCTVTPADFLAELTTRLAGTGTTVADLLVYPESGIANAQYTELDFLTMLTQMQSASVDGLSLYTCEQLWSCWLSAIEMELADPPMPVIANPPPTTGNINLQLPSFLEQFFSCAGFNFSATSAVETEVLGAPYAIAYVPQAHGCLTYLFETTFVRDDNTLFTYDANNLGEEITLAPTIVEGANGPESVLGPTFTGYELLHTCYVNGAPLAADPLQTEEWLQDLRDQKVADCKAGCNARAADFRTQVIASSGLDPQVPAQEAEITCLVNALLRDCRASCEELQVLYDGSTITGLGPESAILHHGYVAGGLFEVTVQPTPAACEGAHQIDPTVLNGPYPPLQDFPNEAEFVELLNQKFNDLALFLINYDSNDPSTHSFEGWHGLACGYVELEYSDGVFRNCPLTFSTQLDNLFSSSGFDYTGGCSTGLDLGATCDNYPVGLACIENNMGRVGLYYYSVSMSGSPIFLVRNQVVNGNCLPRYDDCIAALALAHSNQLDPWTTVYGRFVLNDGQIDYERSDFEHTTGTSLGYIPFECGIRDSPILHGFSSTWDIGETYSLSDIWANPTYNCQQQNPCTQRGLCIRWFANPDPGGLGDPVDLEYVDCVNLNRQSLLDALNLERGRIWQEGRSRFAEQYRSTCANPAAIADVLTISYPTADHHYTLYYYDRAGNLIRTVAPRDVELMADLNSPKNHNNTTGTNFEPSSRYHYNSRGQVEWQRTPDGGLTQFFYDLQGRLRASQNQRQDELQSETSDVQEPNERFSYTKYDALGRIVEVGEVDDPAVVNDLYNPELAFLLSNDPSWPPSGSQVTRTYYTTPYTVDGAPITFSDGRPQRFLNNRVSYSYSDADGTATTEDRVTTIYSYDVHGNVEWTMNHQDHLGYDHLAYTYELVSGRVLTVRYNAGLPDQLFHRYTYDADGRLATAETSSDEVVWDTDASYTYYDHGPLRRHMVGEDKVQGTDHTYTVQGWLKRINDHTLGGLDAGRDGVAGSPNARVGADAFGMMLAYHQGDFVHDDATDPQQWYERSSYLSPQRQLYNGNISAWAARSAKHADETPADYATYGGISGNQYFYDALNRLRTSTWQQFDGTNWADAANDQYREEFNYDANGNITELQRHAFGAVGNTVMDHFSYGLAPVNNRLNTLGESAPNNPDFGGDLKQNNTGRTYQYDATGNLTEESWEDWQTNAEKTIAITWNAYGKVQHVELEDDRSLDFRYNAAQQRVAKIVRGPLPFDPATGDDDIYTYYTHDPSGNVLAIYERRLVALGDGQGYTDEVRLTEQPIYGAERLGMRNPGQEPILVRQWVHPLGQEPYEVQPERLFKSEVHRLALAGRSGWIWPYLVELHTEPEAPLTVASGGDLMLGARTNNLHRAEDLNGNTLFTCHSSEANIFGTPFSSFALHDRNGDLMQNFHQVQADWRNAMQSAKVPGESMKHYLFTQQWDGNNTPLLNVVDLGITTMSQGAVVGPNYNRTLHLPGGSDRYARCMAVLDERATNAPSMLYLKRGSGNLTQIVGVDLDAYAQSGDITASAQVVADFSGRNSTSDNGEMQISPDGRYLIVTNRQNVQAYG
ncbi:MAG: RHS repeat protein, partial [Flavobacteriales bacterium]|nr:RHS repeat protein [Flavobacteriales bacterium]